MNCARHDLVLLPIPFTGLTSRKVRPAVGVGLGSFASDLLLIAVPSQLANADFPLAEWSAAGLNVASGVKAQLATVESSLVLKILGHLSPTDSSTVDFHLRRWLQL